MQRRAFAGKKSVRGIYHTQHKNPSHTPITHRTATSPHTHRTYSTTRTTSRTPHTPHTPSETPSTLTLYLSHSTTTPLYSLLLLALYLLLPLTIALLITALLSLLAVMFRLACFGLLACLRSSFSRVWNTTRLIPLSPTPLPTPSAACGMSYILTIVASRKTAMCSNLAIASVTIAKIQVRKLEFRQFHRVPWPRKYGLRYKYAMFRSATEVLHCGTFPGSIEFIYKSFTLVANTIALRLSSGTVCLTNITGKFWQVIFNVCLNGLRNCARLVGFYRSIRS